MPVSKRDKKVSLTKVLKKGMANKSKIVDEIRENIEKFDNLYVYSIQNLRNGALKDLREKWNGTGRFFFAKRTIMAIALGRDPKSEVKKDLHKISSLLNGEYGLFLTNKPKDEVVQWFDNYSKLEYAKAGFAATETVELPAGPLPEFAPAMEQHLRTLGMPTQLEKGKIVLRENFTVCTKGSFLTPQQASILKLLKKQLAEFKITIVCAWSKDGTFEKFAAAKNLNQSKEIKLKREIKQENPIKKDESHDGGDMDVDGEENIEEEETLHENISTHTESTIKKEKTATKQNNKTPNQTPKQNNKTPNQTPKQTNKTPNETQKQNNKTPNQTPKQVNKTPSDTPKQKSKTPNQTPKQNNQTAYESSKQQHETNSQNTCKKTPKKTPKQASPKKQQDTFFKLEEETSQEYEMKEDASQESEMQEDTQSEFDDLESITTEPSPKLGKANPRRSMRTPKPIKRTPEQRRMSLKKLTDPAGRKDTPKKAASARKSKLPQMLE